MRGISREKGRALAFDPSVNLAIAMAAGTGQYALLLGSGVSRSAGIPTGWEVTLDLVSRIARVQDGEVPADPAAWWAEHRSGAPQYSRLLEELAPQPAERSQLLRSYFEPTNDERDAGTKLPALACRRAAILSVQRSSDSVSVAAAVGSCRNSVSASRYTVGLDVAADGDAESPSSLAVARIESPCSWTAALGPLSATTILRETRATRAVADNRSDGRLAERKLRLSQPTMVLARASAVGVMAGSPRGEDD